MIVAKPVSILPPSHALALHTSDPVAAESLHVAWLTFDAAFLAIVIAWIAALFALRALNVAVKDAKRNAEQLEIALRSPVLEVLFYDSPHSFAQFSKMVFADTAVPTLPRDLSIRNTGSRTSHHVRVEILIQRKAVLRTSISPQDDVF